MPGDCTAYEAASYTADPRVFRIDDVDVSCRLADSKWAYATRLLADYGESDLLERQNSECRSILDRSKFLFDYRAVLDAADACEATPLSDSTWDAAVAMATVCGAVTTYENGWALLDSSGAPVQQFADRADCEPWFQAELDGRPDSACELRGDQSDPFQGEWVTDPSYVTLKEASAALVSAECAACVEPYAPDAYPACLADYQLDLQNIPIVSGERGCKHSDAVWDACVSSREDESPHQGIYRHQGDKCVLLGTQDRCEFQQDVPCVWDPDEALGRQCKVKPELTDLYAKVKQCEGMEPTAQSDCTDIAEWCVYSMNSPAPDSCDRNSDVLDALAREIAARRAPTNGLASHGDCTAVELASYDTSRRVVVWDSQPSCTPRDGDASADASLCAGVSVSHAPAGYYAYSSYTKQNEADECNSIPTGDPSDEECAYLETYEEGGCACTYNPAQGHYAIDASYASTRDAAIALASPTCAACMERFDAGCDDRTFKHAFCCSRRPFAKVISSLASCVDGHLLYYQLATQSRAVVTATTTAATVFVSMSIVRACSPDLYSNYFVPLVLALALWMRRSDIYSRI